MLKVYGRAAKLKSVKRSGKSLRIWFLGGLGGLLSLLCLLKLSLAYILPADYQLRLMLDRKARLRNWRLELTIEYPTTFPADLSQSAIDPLLWTKVTSPPVKVPTKTRNGRLFVKYPERLRLEQYAEGEFPPPLTQVEHAYLEHGGKSLCVYGLAYLTPGKHYTGGALTALTPWVRLWSPAGKDLETTVSNLGGFLRKQKINTQLVDLDRFLGRVVYVFGRGKPAIPAELALDPKPSSANLAEASAGELREGPIKPVVSQVWLDKNTFELARVLLIVPKPLLQIYLWQIFPKNVEIPKITNHDLDLDLLMAKPVKELDVVAALPYNRLATKEDLEGLAVYEMRFLDYSLPTDLGNERFPRVIEEYYNGYLLRRLNLQQATLEPQLAESIFTSGY